MLWSSVIIPPPPRHGTPRMSGVTEWKNAVFLWVNVDEGGGYTNLFEGSVAAGRGGDLANLVADDSPQAMHATSGEARNAARDLSSDVKPENTASVNLGVDINGQPSRAPSTRPEPGGGSSHSGEPLDRPGVGDGGVGRRPAELRMTWYAGGRVTAESALVRRLLEGRFKGETCGYGAADGTAVSAAVSGGSSSGGGAPASAWVSSEDMVGGTLGSIVDDGASNRAISSSHGDKGGITGASGPTSSSVVGGTTHPLTAQSPTVSEPGKPPAAAVTPASAATNIGTIAGDSPTDDERVPSEGGNGGGSSNDSDREDAVLLFCRLPKEPYVFCGRLGYDKHWPCERPVRFVWRLLDAERLAQYPDFAAIVKAAGVTAAASAAEKS